MDRLRGRLTSGAWQSFFAALGDLMSGLESRKQQTERTANDVQNLLDRLNGTTSESPTSPPPSSSNSPSGDINFAQAVSRTEVRAGGGGLAPAVEPVAPGPLPVFRWEAITGADGYVLLLSADETFHDLEWSARVKDGSCAYPSVAPPLNKGRHFWRVFPVDRHDHPLLGSKGAQSEFQVP